MARYKVVSEVKYNGQQIDIPEGAVNVSVQSLPRGSAVRVTYLRPITEVTVGDATQQPARGQGYIG